MDKDCGAARRDPIGPRNDRGAVRGDRNPMDKDRDALHRDPIGSRKDRSAARRDRIPRGRDRGAVDRDRVALGKERNGTRRDRTAPDKDEIAARKVPVVAHEDRSGIGKDPVALHMDRIGIGKDPTKIRKHGGTLSRAYATSHMGPGRAITILHLSDLHFGRHHRFENGDGLDSLLDRLRQDLDERRDKDGLRPDLVVLSGDFAEFGRREELDRAHAFADGLARLVDLPRRRLVMVPGNHDINWHKSGAYFEERASEELAPEEPYFHKFAFYKRFFDRFYEGERCITFTEEEPWSFFEYPELGLVVAGINSVIAESHREGDHYGFVGERQMRGMAEKLRPYKEQGYFRLGVMHHDPRQRKAPRAEQDARDISRILRPLLNLVLHGDIHEERLQWLSGNGPVPVLGIGSAAASIDQRPAEVPNEYQFIQVHRAGLRWALRAYVPDQKTWKGSTRGDEAGDRWIVDVPVSFENVEVLGEAVAAAPGLDLAPVVETYRRAITRNQGVVTVFDLLGVNEAGEGAGGLDFLRVFVPQLATRADERWERREELLDRDVDPGVSPGAEPSRGPEPLGELLFDRAESVDTLLSGRRLFLLGAPGAGKTALTRWLLLKLCAAGEGVPGCRRISSPCAWRCAASTPDTGARPRAGESTASSITWIACMAASF